VPKNSQINFFKIIHLNFYSAIHIFVNLKIPQMIIVNIKTASDQQGLIYSSKCIKLYLKSIFLFLGDLSLPSQNSNPDKVRFPNLDEEKQRLNSEKEVWDHNY